MLGNIPHFVFVVRHLTNKLFRFPKRIIKTAGEDDHLIFRPSIAEKRKRRILRAPYLETNVKVETNTKHIAEQHEKIRTMRNRQRRKIANTILLEGKNLIMEAVAAGIQLQHVLFCE
ncbi:conserved hypothetical protein [Trichinella spiralis]|uniref:hypothetical protein n=1 Tax=Trichinella spiralis TaxID=6334 RepID=UPI0001EFCB65|nr:conserved hypothetical protein [Trichinella spiralis]